MFKFFKALDKWLATVISYFLGFVVVALLVLTLIQVAVRYVFNVSLGGWEEVPMYLMLAGIWLGAANLSRDNTHLSLDGVGLLIKSPKILKPISLIIDLISAIAVSILANYMFEYTQYCKNQGMTTPGIKLPIYVVAAMVTICLVLMAIYKAARSVRQIKELAHGNFN
ncbi:TRAP transporter small permease [uncultured Dysosmobacter sp.]|uniref:TRAP transporter small permease n=1 Tax=uncultured Dysosmobacter sp. TaxID=2591384 RepID=UPI0026244AFB|nr:TRAP transporter small permease [uncultured Dysosmobacter sp.]